MHGPAGNSQLPPTKSHIFILAGKRDSSQGGSSVASTIQGQNSTPSSSLNNSCVADITQRVASTPVATQPRSIITPTATLGTSSHSTPAPRGTSETDSTHHVVSSPRSGMASTPTPLSGLENLPTPIPNPEARVTITNPLQTRATASAKNISVWLGWLHQSGRAPSEPSETPRWRITAHLASKPRVALHITLQSPFHRFFLLCRSIRNAHSIFPIF